ncbi:MAG: dTMP kinase, partial [Sphingomicrobium sp.]
VRDLHRFGSLDYLPDRTLVLVLDEAEGPVRARARDGHLGDRIGSRPPTYHAAVDAGFRKMAEKEPDRVRLIDASGPPATVTARLLYALGDLLP